MLLQEVGCALITRNEHGRRAFGRDTHSPAVNGHDNSTASRPAKGGSAGAGGCALVYLAHCKPELCNALLDANWTPAQLASFAIIGGNSSWLPSARRRRTQFNAVQRSAVNLNYVAGPSSSA
jgi:hypothetical protein